MDTLKYIVKRLLMALFILLGVSVIIFSLSRMMPNDFIDQKYASQLNSGTMKQSDVDRIKKIYGLYTPDAFLSVQMEREGEFGGKKFTTDTKTDTNQRVEDGAYSRVQWYDGAYDYKSYRIVLNTVDEMVDGLKVYSPTSYQLYKVTSSGDLVYDKENAGSEEGGSGEGNTDVGSMGFGKLDEKLELLEEGTWTLEESGNVTLLSSEGETIPVQMIYRPASGWDKTGAVLSSYFNWLGNLMKGDLGKSFKFQQPVGEVIVQNMGISFGISFVATILQFLIAIPLGIKAATKQYGVIDYTVTVFTMIGISLPTFFLGYLFIYLFSSKLGWFPVSGISGSLEIGASGITMFGDMLWHLVLPMIVLVILSIGSLMRYTRTNTLEVLNADYIRTARAKGLSERTVIYKHAFRNTMIPIVTLMAGILPSLFGGAMITETVFAIPGIGKLAYDAMLAADIPFIMGYNMFMAIMTVLGTLLSDLMYAIVDPRVKLGK